MGVELRLLPTIGNDYLAREIIEVPQDRQLYEALETLSKTKGRDCPRQGVSCYCARDKNGETAYGQVIEDNYGNPLKSVTIGELNKVFSDAIIDDEDWKTKAVIAYFSHIPPQFLVYLFWH